MGSGNRTHFISYICRSFMYNVIATYGWKLYAQFICYEVESSEFEVMYWWWSCISTQIDPLDSSQKTLYNKYMNTLNIIMNDKVLLAGTHISAYIYAHNGLNIPTNLFVCNINIWLVWLWCITRSRQSSLSLDNLPSVNNCEWSSSSVLSLRRMGIKFN